MPPVNWSVVLGVPGGVGAAVALWATLGFPTLATGSDVQRLDRMQTETAVEVYDRKVRGYLSVAPPADPVNKQIWEEELRRARDQLKRAEDRKIELSR